MSSQRWDLSAIDGPRIAFSPSQPLVAPPVLALARESSTSPSAEVPGSEDLHAEVQALRGQLARTLAAMEALPGLKKDDGRTPLSLAQSAKRLGVSTSRTLMPAVAAGVVATIRWGRRRRIAIDEIERLERDGFGGKKPRKRASGLRAAAPQTPMIGRRGRLTYADALAGR
jgi:hypothetical protein